MPIPGKDNSRDVFADGHVLFRRGIQTRKSRLFAGASDHHLDAAILGATLRRRVGSNRNVRSLAVDMDPRRVAQSQLEKRSNRFGPLNREIPIGRETHRFNRCIVGISDNPNPNPLLV